jgi:aspartokinase-like uncharacterized kinase
MARPRAVAKVGGSLFDLPDLGPRLRRWLKQAFADVLLVPGGGPTTDAVRRLDQIHQLGEEQSHWLALRALSVNAAFLAGILPEAQIVSGVDDWSVAAAAGRPAVLDSHAFCVADVRDDPAGALPRSWAVTSDSVAARFAAVAEADSLVLLKSATMRSPVDWEEASRREWVDAWFATEVNRAPRPFRISAVNFRAGDAPPVD